jgi:hypothetical protein
VNLCPATIIISLPTMLIDLAVQTPLPHSLLYPISMDHRLSVSLILGAAGTSSGAATTGGVVESGEGTWSELLWPRPSELLRLGVNGCGLTADPDADAGVCVGVAGGWVAELNSAQRGHLRFVSERIYDAWSAWP